MNDWTQEKRDAVNKRRRAMGKMPIGVKTLAMPIGCCPDCKFCKDREASVHAKGI